MKILFLLLIIIVFISCKPPGNSNEVDYRGFLKTEISLVGFDKQIKLTDSLGVLSIMIPFRLDTFYQWHRTSDCLSCGWLQYRFADKRYPKFTESGFYWTYVRDSSYHLDIWHKPIKEIPDSMQLKPLKEKDTIQWSYLPHLVDSEKQDNYLFKEFRLINERPFLITAFISSYGYLTHTETLYVIAETNLIDRELYFIGECSAKDTTGFIDNIYKSFLSIRIIENP